MKLRLLFTFTILNYANFLFGIVEFLEPNPPPYDAQSHANSLSLEGQESIDVKFREALEGNLESQVYFINYMASLSSSSRKQHSLLIQCKEYANTNRSPHASVIIGRLRMLDGAYSSAATWFDAETLKGNLLARKYLGIMHWLGQGVRQNDREALWLLIASHQWDDDIKRFISLRTSTQSEREKFLDLLYELMQKHNLPRYLIQEALEKTGNHELWKSFYALECQKRRQNRSCVLM